MGWWQERQPKIGRSGTSWQFLQAAFVKRSKQYLGDLFTRLNIDVCRAKVDEDVYEEQQVYDCVDDVENCRLLCVVCYIVGTREAVESRQRHYKQVPADTARVVNSEQELLYTALTNELELLETTERYEEL